VRRDHKLRAAVLHVIVEYRQERQLAGRRQRGLRLVEEVQPIGAKSDARLGPEMTHRATATFGVESGRDGHGFDQRRLAGAVFTDEESHFVMQLQIRERPNRRQAVRVHVERLDAVSLQDYRAHEALSGEVEALALARGHAARSLSPLRRRR
jgi:hypothetical protein